MSPPAVREAAQQAYATSLKEDSGYEERKTVERQRYQAMLAKVEAWEAPTSDHIGFKEFMTEQLTSSIEFDCPPGGFSFRRPQKLEPDAWLNAEVAQAQRDLDTSITERAKEIERTEGRNRWLSELRRSLVEETSHVP